MDNIDFLLDKIKEKILHKKTLYDGFDQIAHPVYEKDNIKKFMFSVVEEVGEVSSAITRDRMLLARDECIDIIHSAILLYLAIDQKLD